MHPSFPLTHSWPESLKCCPSLEQRECTLITESKQLIATNSSGATCLGGGCD